MKRSEVNHIMRRAIDFFEEQNFYLPKFAYWTVEDWKRRVEEGQEIIKNQLGWDISDYGENNFYKKGLVHFTIRNGNVEGLKKGGKPYCEKVMIIEENQSVPLHHHQTKIEDIINRGGGILKVQVYNVGENEEIVESPVLVSLDGIEKRVEAGSILELTHGESITLKPIHYHKFWAKKGTGRVLIGEVSSVNDDYKDNKFKNKIKRFSEIEEDETPLYLLYNDYRKFLNL
ncbi:MAG: D-lyxose/D-mannose family sugar isomerase [Candidatus Hodarchaeota archaeon]